MAVLELLVDQGRSWRRVWVERHEHLLLTVEVLQLVLGGGKGRTGVRGHKTGRVFYALGAIEQQHGRATDGSKHVEIPI